MSHCVPQPSVCDKMIRIKMCTPKGQRNHEALLWNAGQEAVSVKARLGVERLGPSDIHLLKLRLQGSHGCPVHPVRRRAD